MSHPKAGKHGGPSISSRVWNVVRVLPGYSEAKSTSMAKMSRVVWGDWLISSHIYFCYVSNFSDVFLVSMTGTIEVLKPRFLPVGGSVEFYIFEDDAGLGAEECTLTEPLGWNAEILNRKEELTHVNTHCRTSGKVKVARATRAGDGIPKDGT